MEHAESARSRLLQGDFPKFAENWFERMLNSNLQEKAFRDIRV